jgi:fimbrial chaperone protein
VPDLRAIAVAAAFLLGAELAAASGLQVSPVSLTLHAGTNAEGLWLSNTGDGVVHAQARVYRWTQEDGVEQLTPSRDLVASPPILQIAPGGRQLVRVVRLSAGGSASAIAEQAFRIVVDELPTFGSMHGDLQFVLHYSLPVFVETGGAALSPPRLGWALRHEGGKTFIEVVNDGASHAQLADLQFVDDAGHRTDAHSGLLGYVLPGARMRWALSAPAAPLAPGTSLQVTVNGRPASQVIPLADNVR